MLARGTAEAAPAGTLRGSPRSLRRRRSSAWDGRRPEPRPHEPVESLDHRGGRQTEVPQLAVGRRVAHAFEGEEQQRVVLRRSRGTPGARVQLAEQPELPRALAAVKPARDGVGADERRMLARKRRQRRWCASTTVTMRAATDAGRPRMRARPPRPPTPRSPTPPGLEEDRALVREVLVERARGVARGARDAVGVRAVEAVAVEDPRRGRDQAAAGVGGARAAAGRSARRAGASCLPLARRAGSDRCITMSTEMPARFRVGATALARRGRRRPPRRRRRGRRPAIVCLHAIGHGAADFARLRHRLAPRARAGARLARPGRSRPIARRRAQRATRRSSRASSTPAESPGQPSWGTRSAARRRFASRPRIRSASPRWCSRIPAGSIAPTTSWRVSPSAP